MTDAVERDLDRAARARADRAPAHDRRPRARRRLPVLRRRRRRAVGALPSRDGEQLDFRSFARAVVADDRGAWLDAMVAAARDGSAVAPRVPHPRRGRRRSPGCRPASPARDGPALRLRHRRHRAQGARGRAARRARGGRERRPREVALPGDDEPRAAHAARRGHRHARGARARRAHRRAARARRHRHALGALAARRDRRRARLLEDRGRPPRPRAGAGRRRRARARRRRAAPPGRAGRASRCTRDRRDRLAPATRPTRSGCARSSATSSATR